MSAAEHASAALYGLAIGDALGMPAETLSRGQITTRWGPKLTGFEPAPPGHPLAEGMPAGAVTDDTEQAVLLARLLIKGDGRIDPRELADALVSWEQDMTARGSRSLLGPSTKRALDAIRRGVPPEEAGAGGATNGAAMRIAPVGIAFAADLAADLIATLVGTSLATQESVPAAFAVLSALPDDPWQACCWPRRSAATPTRSPP